MTENRNIDDTKHEVGEPTGDAPATEQPTPIQPASPDMFMPLPSTGKEAWRGGGSGCGPRARLYLMIVAAAGLIAILLVGLSVLRHGVWATMDQGRQAVVQNLPLDLPAGERQRTIKNLDRFRRVLEKSDDPFPTMGEFMTRVRAVLRDGRLTVDEVSGLNVYMERVIEESGIPPLQLGCRIKNEELGIRNVGQSAFLDPDVRLGWNSSFLIPHSSFA